MKNDVDYAADEAALRAGSERFGQHGFIGRTGTYVPYGPHTFTSREDAVAYCAKETR